MNKKSKAIQIAEAKMIVYFWLTMLSLFLSIWGQWISHKIFFNFNIYVDYDSYLW